MADESERSGSGFVVVAIGLVGLAIVGGLVGLWLSMDRGKSPQSNRPPTSHSVGGAAIASRPPVRGLKVDTSRLPTVYAADFSSPTADEAWDRRDIGQTPTGQRYLGKIGRDGATFSLVDLPKHDRLRISFDLLIFDTWDGNGKIDAAGGVCGPDFIHITLDNERNVFRHTFSNLPWEIPNFARTGKLQTYPSPIPSEPNRAFTGASASNSMGVVFTFRNVNVSFPMDARYPVQMTLPHTRDSLQLNFRGEGLSGKGDESFAITNVQVQVLNAADLPKADAAQLGKWFGELIAGQPASANAAFWNLVAAGDETVKFLEQTVGGLGFDPAAVDRLLDTAHPDNTPEKALAGLIALGPAIEPRLLQLAAEDPDMLEVLDEAMQEVQLQAIASPVKRRTAAACRLLAVIRTPAADAAYSRLCAKPEPLPKPGSSEWEADWHSRFLQLYSLQKEQAVKFVPQPWPTEREQFVAHWFRQHYVFKQNVETDDVPTMEAARPRLFVFDGEHLDTNYVAYTDSTVIGDQRLPERGLLRYVYLLNAQHNPMDKTSRRVHVPESLSNVQLTGDWIVRRQANQYQRLMGLRDAVVKQTGRPLRFERGKSPEPAVVVKGKYAFKADRAGDPADALHAYTRRRDPGDRATRINARLSDVLSTLRGYTGVEFIDQTESGQQMVNVFIHNSAQFPQATGDDQIARVQGLCDRLAAQTGLTFTLETREIEAWIAVEGAAVEKE